MILFFLNNFSLLQNTGIMRAILEELGCYDLILSPQELIFLDEMASVLKPFDEITKLAQGVDYPTINLIPLLVAEIEERLQSLRLFLEDALIVGAIDILLLNLRNRIQLTDIVIAAGCLDPAVQHLPLINDWLRENGMYGFLIKFPDI